MTIPRNPRTFEWEHDEQRGEPFRAGSDGFFETPDLDPPQIIIEVTLRFDGVELKGYSDVFDVEQKAAPVEVICDGCVT